MLRVNDVPPERGKERGVNGFGTIYAYWLFDLPGVSLLISSTDP